MVRRSKRFYTGVGVWSCCWRYRAVRAAARRSSPAAAARLSDARFSGDPGAAADSDYDDTRTDMDAGSVGNYGNAYATTSDKHAGSAAGDSHACAGDVNADDYAHEYTDALGAGFSTNIEG